VTTYFMVTEMQMNRIALMHLNKRMLDSFKNKKTVWILSLVLQE